MIGQSPCRKEDERLLVGRGRFVDDIRLPGLLHAAFARSTHARARLVRVDASAAAALPGVMAFVADDPSRTPSTIRSTAASTSAIR